MNHTKFQLIKKNQKRQQEREKKRSEKITTYNNIISVMI